MLLLLFYFSCWTQLQWYTVLVNEIVTLHPTNFLVSTYLGRPVKLRVCACIESVEIQISEALGTFFHYRQLHAVQSLVLVRLPHGYLPVCFQRFFLILSKFMIILI